MFRDLNTWNKIQELIVVSENSQCGGFQIAGLGTKRFVPEENRLVFHFYTQQRVQNGMGTLFGGTIGVLFDEVSSYLIMLIDPQERSGNTVDIDVNFCRSVPIGTTILIDAQIVDMENDLVFVKIDATIEKTGQLCNSGTVVKRLSGSPTANEIMERIESDPSLQTSPYDENRTIIPPDFHSNLFNEVILEDPHELSEMEKNKLNTVVWWTHHWKQTDVLNGFSGSVSKNLELVSVNMKNGSLTARLGRSHWIENKGGNLHAGVLFGLNDEITSVLTMISTPRETPAVSIYLKIHLLCHSFSDFEQSDILIISRATKVGSRIYFLDILFVSEKDGRPIAYGSHIMTPSDPKPKAKL